VWFAAAILPSVPGDETLDPIDAGLDGLLNGGQSRASLERYLQRELDEEELHMIEAEGEDLIGIS
jgi:hypothetical protein